MKNQELIRKVFQTFTVILFIVQFQQSVRKYFEYPVVVQTSQVAVQDLQAPVVYICQDDQFNYTKSISNGYEFFTKFMAGILMNTTSTITWNGYHGNHTYKELENLLFDYDYSKLDLSKNKKWVYNNTLRFIFPHGVCMKFLNVQSQPWLILKTAKKVKVLFVDPARANTIRTGANFDAEGSIGPVFSTHFQFRVYDVDYSLHDESIYDGSSCTNYEKLDSSYGECLMAALKDEFLTNYGCVAPWIPGNNSEKVCGNVTKIEAKSTEHTLIYKILLELVKNQEPDLFRKCLLPCKTMVTKLQKVLDKSN